MQDEFDEDSLHKLIDEALEERSLTPLEPLSKAIPFAFNDSNLLELLSNLLPSYMHQADIQMVLADLRDEMYRQIHVGNLRDLHSVVQYCRRCSNVEVNPTLPLWNLKNPDMVLVSDNVNRNADDYLIKVLKDVGFSSKNIALTYMTRCPIKGRSPDAGEIANCSGYLFAELQMLRPKLIVPIGNISTAEFIGSSKITEVHGKIFWIGPWAIMPVLSPGYVQKAEITDKFEQDLANAYKFIYGG